MKNNASFIQRPNITINSFGRYTQVSFITTTETSSPKWLLYTGLTVPSYLLKVTKFLDKISQFEFLLMTEKNIFAYKLFLALNVLGFNFFYVKIATPPPPSPLKKGEVHTMFRCQMPTSYCERSETK